MTSCILFGGSGAVGTQVLKCLKERHDVTEIFVFLRKKILNQLFEESDKVKTIIATDISIILDSFVFLQRPNIGFCCIGANYFSSTTEEFISVEKDLVVKIANFCRNSGCHEFHLCFASNPRSWFLVPRTKGEAEEKIKRLVFDTLCVYRPGILRVPEGRAQFRLFDAISRTLSDLIDFGDWWSITVADVAKCMVHKMGKEDGTIIFEHGDMVKNVRCLME